MWGLCFLSFFVLGVHHVDQASGYGPQARPSFVRPNPSQLDRMLEDRKHIFKSADFNGPHSPQSAVEKNLSSEHWDILNSNLHLNSTQALKSQLIMSIENSLNKTMKKHMKNDKTIMDNKLFQVMAYFHEISLGPSVCQNRSSCLSSFPPASLAALLAMAHHVSLDGLELTTDLWSWLAVMTKYRATQSFTLSHTNVTGDNTDNLVAVIANIEEVELVGIQMENCSLFIKSLASDLQAGWTRRIVFEGRIVWTCQKEVEELAMELRWAVEKLPGSNRMAINRCVRVTDGRFFKDSWIPGECMVVNERGLEAVWTGFPGDLTFNIKVAFD